jgi:acyl-coenzyme A thioesterase PaaI-like protein
MNVWPPYLAAGIRVRHLSDDFRRAEVALRLGLLNRNYVNVHFGGSLFAMTDPFYMLMYMKNLGDDYVVWDKAASIDFIRPGKGTVSAQFSLNEDDFTRAREQASRQKSVLLVHPVEIRDVDQKLIARVERTIYVRRKPDSDTE